MLVSVCVPAYNAERYIRNNLDSILGQTYQDIEIIIIDDASSDGTAEIIREYQRKYPSKIEAYFLEKNRGLGAARNLALSQTRGEYVFFCDSDDALKPNCIDALVKEAEMQGFPDIVIDGFTRLDAHGKLLYERIYQTKEMALAQGTTAWAKMTKRVFLIDNEIRFPEGLFMEDVFYQAVIVSYQPKVAMIQNCGYFYIKNLDSVSQARLNGFFEGWLEKGFDYLADSDSKLCSNKQKHIMMYYIMQAVTWYLLKSGTGIGGKKTVVEYQKAKDLLDKYFPDYKKMNYVSMLEPKDARMVVRWAVLGVSLLMKFHLAKAFFYIYGSFNFSRFWPNL